MAFKGQLTSFGKKIKMKLLELNQSQEWLISEINKLGIVYADSSNLYKFMTGQIKRSKMEDLIKEILNIN